jgi:hypothetical protein
MSPIEISKKSDTKDCPFCAEKIKIKAIKCKHCGSVLPPKKPIRSLESKSDEKPSLGLIGSLTKIFLVILGLSIMYLLCAFGGWIGLCVVVVLIVLGKSRY